MFKTLLEQLRQFAQGGFIRNVGLLAGATAVAQVANFLALPVYARLYDPAQFGALAAFTAAAAIIITIGSGRYHLALVLEESSESKSALLYLSLGLIFGVAILAVFTLIGLQLLEVNVIPGGKPDYWWLSPVIIIPAYGGIMALNATFDYWFNAHLKYSNISKGRITNVVTTVITTLALGYAGIHYGLMAGLLAGATAQLLLYLLLAKPHQVPFPGWGAIRAIAKKHQNQPKYNLPHSFTDTIRQNVFVYLIIAFFGESAMGFINMMLKVMFAPIQLVGNAISEVYIKRSASLLQERPLALIGNIKKLLSGGAALMIPFLIIMLAAAPALFSWIFGPEWEMSGTLARIYAPMSVLLFLLTLIVPVVIVIQQQRDWLFLSLAVQATIYTAFFLYLYFYGGTLPQAVLFKTGIEVCFYSYLIYWIYKKTIAVAQATALKRTPSETR